MYIVQPVEFPIRGTLPLIYILLRLQSVLISLHIQHVLHTWNSCAVSFNHGFYAFS